MSDGLVKNLWLLLTLIIPGCYTYGLWRILLLIEPLPGLGAADLKQIDESGLLTTCIILALALVQQAISMLLEALLCAIATLRKDAWPTLHELFCKRFSKAASGKLNENTTRIIGNFFQSLNICAGTGILFIFFTFRMHLPIRHWIPLMLSVVFGIALIVTVFRMFHAIWMLRDNKPSATEPVEPLARSLKNVYTYWVKQISATEGEA